MRSGLTSRCSTESHPASLAGSCTRAPYLYNALHRFWGRRAAAAALRCGPPLGYVAGAIAWGLHVAFDRAIGLRPRSTASSWELVIEVLAPESD